MGLFRRKRAASAQGAGAIHVETGMPYQLVLQWTASSETDFDELIRMEVLLETALHTYATVDGHDFGSGEMNIFIETKDPKQAFADAQTVLGDAPRWSQVRAGYRAFTENSYTVIWPPGLAAFSVA
jgi:hypothetical protein